MRSLVISIDLRFSGIKDYSVIERSETSGAVPSEQGCNSESDGLFRRFAVNNDVGFQGQMVRSDVRARGQAGQLGPAAGQHMIDRQAERRRGPARPGRI